MYTGPQVVIPPWSFFLNRFILFRVVILLVVTIAGNLILFWRTGQQNRSGNFKFQNGYPMILLYREALSGIEWWLSFSWLR